MVSVPNPTASRYGYMDVTPDNPCPVCGREKYCSWSHRTDATDTRATAIVCNFDDEWGTRKGRELKRGWLFQLTGNDPQPVLRDTNDDRPPVDFTKFVADAIKSLRDCTATTAPDVLLSRSLGLPDDAYRSGLMDLGDYASRYGPGCCWPEYGEGNAPVGVMRRPVDGFERGTSKKTISGSRRGLTYAVKPPYWKDGDPVYVVEGESCVVALRAAGLWAVGRPGAKSTDDVVAALVTSLRSYVGSTVVVVGENDGGVGTTDPYVLGDQLRAKLPNPVLVAMTPDLPAEAVVFSAKVKDSRAYLTAEGWGETSWADRGVKLAAALLKGTNAERPKDGDPKNTGKSKGKVKVTYKKKTLEGVEGYAVRWLVPGLIPVSAFLIAGPGGVGKSTVMVDTCAKLTSGHCCMGLEYPDPITCEVMVLVPEDDVGETTLPLFLAAGGDVTKYHREPEWTDEKGDRLPFDFGPAAMERLIEYLEDHPGIKLLVIESLSSACARRGVKLNNDEEVRTIMDPLRERISQGLGVSVAAIAHTRKDRKSGSAQDSVAGSAGIVNAVRGSYTFDRDPEDRDLRVMVRSKNNYIGVHEKAVICEQIPLTDDEAAPVMAHAAFAKRDADEKALIRRDLRKLNYIEHDRIIEPEDLGGKITTTTKEEAAVAWLRKELQYGEAVASIVLEARAEDAGIKAKTYRRARDELKKEGLTSEKVGGAWFVRIGFPTCTSGETAEPLNPLNGLD